MTSSYLFFILYADNKSGRIVHLFDVLKYQKQTLILVDKTFFCALGYDFVSWLVQLYISLLFRASDTGRNAVYKLYSTGCTFQTFNKKKFKRLS